MGFITNNRSIAMGTEPIIIESMGKQNSTWVENS